MTIRATCPSCPKTYRVPHADKEWRCKECDAVLELEVEDAPASEPDLGGRTCQACGAISFGDGEFCEECGSALDSRGSRLTKTEAATEMRHGTKRIRRLKGWLGFNLFLALLGTLIVVLLFVNTEGLTTGVILVIAAIQAVVLTLSYAAYQYVDRRPFPIVVTLAAFKTLDVIWSYYSETPWVLGAIFAAILWGLVPDAAKVSRLAKEHPDLYLSRRMRGEHLSHRKGDGSDSVRRRNRGRGKAQTNWPLVLGVVTGLLVLGFATVKALDNRGTGPAYYGPREVADVDLPPPAEVLEDFRRAWNSHDIDALARMTKESLREKMRNSLESLGERYDWGTVYPQLEAAEYSEPTSPSLRVTFPSEAGDFPVRFVVEDGDWVVRTIRTSPLKDWRP